jgi:ATP-dependent 26S proteasome regulatory subunit
VLPQIRMPRPDTSGRYDILRLQLTSKDVSSDVDLLQLARDLPGLVGADLANIVNEAQLNGEQLLDVCYIVVVLAMWGRASLGGS